MTTTDQMTAPQPDASASDTLDPAPARPTGRRAWLAVAAGFTGGVLLTGAVVAGWTMTTSGSGSTLTAAKAECADSNAYAKLGDGGRTLDVAGTGEEHPGAGVTSGERACILDELGAPASVRMKMGHTRALDGMQSATWGDYEATWTYHPDDGLQLVITTN